MSPHILEEIETKTRDLLRSILGELEQIETPINLAKILDYYGLSLEIAKFKLENVGGAYDKSKKIIYLAVDDSPKRQSFTVAHELGHHLLGHKKDEIFYRHQATDFNGQNKKDEKEANYFAASLLMPRELVVKFWERSKDIELLAAYFGVSTSAAFWRIKNLGLH